MATNSHRLESRKAESRIEKGRRLKAKREEMGFPITTLARLSSVSPNTIRTIERGAKYHDASLQQINNVLYGPAPAFDRPFLTEDLDIAWQYHNAPTVLRIAVAKLLSGDYDGIDADVIAYALEVFSLPARERRSLQVLTVHYRETLDYATVNSAGRTVGQHPTGRKKSAPNRVGRT